MNWIENENGAEARIWKAAVAVTVAGANEWASIHSQCCVRARSMTARNQQEPWGATDRIDTHSHAKMNEQKKNEKHTHTQRARNKARRFRNQNTHDGIE